MSDTSGDGHRPTREFRNAMRAFASSDCSQPSKGGPRPLELTARRERRVYGGASLKVAKDELLAAYQEMKPRR